MSDKKVELTARETELAVLAWRAVKEPQAIQIDYDKLCKLGGFKNVASTRASFASTKKKLFEGDAVATPIKPQAGDKRVAAAGGNQSDDDPTPTKKPRGRGKTRGVPRATKTNTKVDTKADTEDDAVDPEV